MLYWRKVWIEALKLFEGITGFYIFRISSDLRASMKKRISFLMFCVSFSCHAQNLVLNGNLDSYITCPGFGQFSNAYINDWDKPSYGSTDYYHNSCPGILPTQQIPRSGDAYAGIIGYNYGAEYREYMTGTLSTPLIPGATYYCEFYLSLNDGYIQAIKEMGAYFSASFPGPYTNALHVPVTPQIENTLTLLDDTSGWMRVSGYFLASGGEQYITIGNFNDDTNTTVVQVGNVGSYGTYYFVDDVWVSLSEGTGTSSVENRDVNIFLNAATGILSFKSKSALNSISVYDVTGKIVLSSSMADKSYNTDIDVQALASGVYVAEAVCGEKISRKKFVKQ